MVTSSVSTFFQEMAAYKSGLASNVAEDDEEDDDDEEEDDDE